MALKRHEFTFEDPGMLLRAFNHFHRSVIPKPLTDNNNQGFKEWLKENYNLELDTGNYDECHVVVSHKDEDWVRFVLEWS